jgi:nucleotide-binding universal stress UspA family protein
MTKKILVPLDGSTISQSIVSWAGELARAMDGELRLLTVIDPKDFEVFEAVNNSVFEHENLSVFGGPVETAAKTPTDIIDALGIQFRIELEAKAKALGKAGIKAEVKIEYGSPAEVIVAEAKTQNVDMIAMTTRRGSALARGILGSVTDRVLHSTSVPVLTLHPNQIGNAMESNGLIRKIVIPLDGSELSETAVRPALEIARASKADVTFLRVVNTPLYAFDSGVLGAGALLYDREIEMGTQEEDAMAYLKGLVEEAGLMGIKAHATVRIGNASLQIASESITDSGSIVVMATSGASGLKRWVIGSVADKVIRSGNVPVLVIPHAK